MEIVGPLVLFIAVCAACLVGVRWGLQVQIDAARAMSERALDRIGRLEEEVELLARLTPGASSRPSRREGLFVSRSERLAAEPAPCVKESTENASAGSQRHPESAAPYGFELPVNPPDPPRDPREPAGTLSETQPTMSGTAAPLPDLHGDRRAQGEPAPSVSWETVLGGRWLGAAGAVTVVFTVGLFLKWAYDLGWITPLLHLPRQVYLVLGWLVGAACLVAGERLRLHVPLYARCISGAGISALYVTSYAAHALYQVLDAAGATALLLLTGVLTLILSLRHRSAVIGWAGVVLAYGSPLLFGAAALSPVPLLLYVSGLNVAVLAISVRYDWPGFRASACAATILLYAWWHLQQFSPALLGLCLGFGTLHALLFLAILVAPPMFWRVRTCESDLVVAIAAPLSSGLLFWVLLHAPDPRRLAAAVLGLACAYGAASWMLARRLHPTEGSGPKTARRLGGPPGASDYLQQLCLAATVVFGLWSIPLAFRGPAITAAWALAGAGLSWSGASTRSRQTWAWGAVATALSVLRFVAAELLPQLPGDRGFQSGLAFTITVPALVVVAAVVQQAALLGAAWIDEQRPENGAEENMAITAGGAAVLLFVWLYAALYGGSPFPGQQQPAICCLAVALIWLAGWRIDSAALRNTAAALALVPYLLCLTSYVSGAADATHASAWAVLLLGAYAGWRYLRAESTPEGERTRAAACTAAVLALAFVLADRYLGATWGPVFWCCAAGTTVLLGRTARSAELRWVGLAGATAAVTVCLARAAETPPRSELGLATGLALLAGLSAAAAEHPLGSDREQRWHPVAACLAAAAAGICWAVIRLGPGWESVAVVLVLGVLLWFGSRRDEDAIRLSAAAPLTVLTCLLASLYGPERAQVAGLIRGISAAACVGGWCACAAVLRHTPAIRAPRAAQCVEVAAGLVALAWLTVEAGRLNSGHPATGSGTGIAQFAVSAVWVVYAAVAITVGFRLRRPDARWGGLVLLTAAIGRIYLLDLTGLPTGYRVLSFLVLALVLLGVSFRYQADRLLSPGGKSD